MLNDEQMQAVYSDSPKILCLAGAGAGKTKVMIERISNLVNNNKIDPTSILVLTFTNAAAAEMLSRYKSNTKSKTLPEFRTFHAFCYSLISIDPDIRNELGYVNIPDIVEEPVMKQINKEAKVISGVSLSDAKLSQTSQLSSKEAYQKDIYLRTLKKLIRTRNVITFNSLAEQVTELFWNEEKSHLTQKYKDKYKYIFVDEFQDTDPTQFKFLNTFDANFFFVGDARQNIYSFRGTTNEYIKTLSKSTDWQNITLKENYRSTQEICEFSTNIAKLAHDKYFIEMHGQRSGSLVECINVNKPRYSEKIGQDTVSALMSRLQSHPGNCAILCRTNAEVAEVKDILNDHGYLISDKGPDETGCILRSIIDDEYFIAYCTSKLKSEKYLDFIRFNLYFNMTLDEVYEKYIKQYDEANQIYDTVMNYRKMLDKYENKYECYKQIALHAHIGIAINVESSIQTDEDIVNQLLIDLNNRIETSIYVGTIHSVKGLEYDIVHILNVGNSTFRIDSEDMINLYYVAATRAKNRLFVYKVKGGV